MRPAFRQLRLWYRTTREDGLSGLFERPVTRVLYVGMPPRDPGEATTGRGLVTIGNDQNAADQPLRVIKVAFVVLLIAEAQRRGTPLGQPQLPPDLSN